MVRIQLVNKTRYDSKALRSLLSEALRRWLRDGDKLPWPRVRVECVPARGRPGASGYAYYHNNYMKLKLPYGWTAAGSDGRGKQPRPWETDDGLGFSVAWIFYHELDHCLGKTHDHMNNGFYKEWAGWAKGRSLPFTAPKPEKPRPNVVDVRAERAQANLERWQRKLKLAETKVKQYERKVRHYQNRKPEPEVS